MDSTWIEYVPWLYATVQGIVTIAVTIMGVKCVRNEFLLQKSTLKEQTELTVNNTSKHNQSNETEPKESQLEIDHIPSPKQSVANYFFIPCTDYYSCYFSKIYGGNGTNINVECGDKTSSCSKSSLYINGTNSANITCHGSGIFGHLH